MSTCFLNLCVFSNSNTGEICISLCERPGPLLECYLFILKFEPIQLQREGQVSDFPRDKHTASVCLWFEARCEMHGGSGNVFSRDQRIVPDPHVSVMNP